MKTLKNNDNLSPEQVKGKIVDFLEENHIDLPDEIRRTIEKYLLAPLEKTKEVEEASNDNNIKITAHMDNIPDNGGG